MTAAFASAAGQARKTTRASGRDPRPLLTIVWMSPAVVIRSPLRALAPGLVAILAAFVPAPAAARTWHLTPGGGDAPTIQSAIDQSDDGDTLALATGFYSERIRIVNKTLLVQGAGMERTTLSGTDLQSAHGHAVEL